MIGSYTERLTVPRKERQSDLFRPFDARELLADERVSLDIGLLDPSASEAGESPSIEQLTVSVADDLRRALAEIEAFAEELGVDLSELNRSTVV